MLTIGLVGAGFIGKTHLKAYQQIKNVQVTHICTKDEQLANQYGARWAPDFDTLLADTQIDVIDICLPTYLHEEAIVKAANAGKHIICEKPLTLTVESARRIVAAVERNNVELFVGHVLRFWPEYQKIKADFSNSSIEAIDARRLGQLPSWGTWFQHPDKSGGALFDLHLHDIDYCYYLLGEVDIVYAVGHKNSYGAWDHVMTTLSFANGAKAFVEASQRMPAGYPFTMSFRAQTNKGTVDFYQAAGENIDSIDASKPSFHYYTNKKKVAIDVAEVDPFVNELSYFVGCLENKQVNNVIPLEDVRYTLKLLAAIEKSLEFGCSVHV